MYIPSVISTFIMKLILSVGIIFGALLVPDAGEVRLGQAALGISNMSATVKIKLYISNTTPAEADVRTTYTEATGFGYAEISIVNANWTGPTTTAGVTEAAYPQQTWTFTGALGNVYGYLVCDGTSGTIMWAERFSDGPYNIANNGDQIKITPKIQFA